MEKIILTSKLPAGTVAYWKDCIVFTVAGFTTLQSSLLLSTGDLISNCYWYDAERRND